MVNGVTQHTSHYHPKAPPTHLPDMTEILLKKDVKSDFIHPGLLCFLAVLGFKELLELYLYITNKLILSVTIHAKVAVD